LLLAALGLAATATEAEAVAALDALKTQTGQVATLTAEIATLKAAADPAQFAPVATVIELQTQVAALTKQIADQEVDDLIQVGLSDGRILPSMEAWARTLNKAALTGYLDKAQPVAALKSTQTGGKPADGVDASLPVKERCEAEWKNSAALRAEFGSVEAFTAYTKANEAGLVKIQKTQE